MENLLNNYVNFLRQRLSYTQLGEWYEITTPFLNTHNDRIQIYVRQRGKDIEITDAGETIADLELTGVNFDRSEKRKKELDAFLRSFGVQLNKDKELIAKTTEAKFPQVKHRFIQCLLSVGDMFLLAEPKVEKFFMEDVANFLDIHDVPNVPNVGLTGKSDFAHTFEFSIPKTKEQPEKLIKLLNYYRQDLLEHTMWVFEDTKTNRPNSKGIVIINDEIKVVGDEVFSALENYNLAGFRWSERENLLLASLKQG